MAAEPARSGRAWAWFFVILIVLTLTAIGVEIWYNAGQQLTWEQLQAAEQLWKQRGPADYDLDYTVKKLDSTERFHAEIRDKKVVLAKLQDQPLEERVAAYRDMPHLFGDIEGFWERDHADGKATGPRTFVTAVFAKEDGRVLHYVRSVMSTRERTEITVQLRATARATD